MRPKITVLLPCCNNEKTIRKTLESVKWADEILVVDSGSQDATLTICKEYTSRILQHEYVNSATQKNWAIPQCQHEWVLQIDSDEVLEPALKDEILNNLESVNENVQAFRMPRKNYGYGRWLKYSRIYPDYQTRIFRRDVGKFESREVDAHLRVPGKVVTLKNHILHDDFKNIASWINKFERYTRYDSDQLIKEGRRFSVLQVTIFPFVIFIRNYFLQQGFRDGFVGFQMAVFASFYYFVRYLRFWEKKNKKDSLY